MGDMQKLADRMEHVIREHILVAMPADISGVLAAMPIDHLVVTYATWMGRLIPPRPRRCHCSTELAASQKAVEHQASLDGITKEIESGADLKPRLSKRILVAHDPMATATASLSRREDRDLLIADWGIHHLHLSSEVESDGFVKRGGDLLFAAFRDDDAYLIGIYQHLTDWARKDILEIVVRNWPTSGIVLETQAIGLTNEFTDEERRQLRNAGISSPMVEVDGKVWAAAALGHALDGTPMRAAQTRMALVHALNEWREYPDERLADAEHAVDKAAGRPVTGKWKPVVYDEWAGLQREDVFHPIARLSGPALHLSLLTPLPKLSARR
jgi:hypothetical protein